MDLIQFSIDYVKKFSNWFRNSCTVSITTVAIDRVYQLDKKFFNLNKISQQICVCYS